MSWLDQPARPVRGVDVLIIINKKNGLYLYVSFCFRIMVQRNAHPFQSFMIILPLNVHFLLVILCEPSYCCCQRVFDLSFICDSVFRLRTKPNRSLKGKPGNTTPQSFLAARLPGFMRVLKGIVLLSSDCMANPLASIRCPDRTFQRSDDPGKVFPVEHPRSTRRIAIGVPRKGPRSRGKETHIERCDGHD